MENNISNLIKNVLEENAVKFKEDTSKILYSKVSDRLKQEYVTVSKNLFSSINEAIANRPSGASRSGLRPVSSATGTPRLRPAPTRNPNQHGGGFMGPGFHGGGLLPGANVDFAGMANDTPIALPVTGLNSPRSAYSSEEDEYPEYPPPLPNPNRTMNPFMQGPIQQHSGGITPQYYVGGQL